MERGESKGNPTGSTHFSTPEEMPAGTSSRPLTFRQEKSDNDFNEISEEDPEQENQKAKGTHNAIEIVNPNLVKPKSMKSQDADHCITEVQSYCEKSDGECHRRYTIGYAILEKKKISFMQDSLICLARDRGIILVPIDISLPLTEQGPFDFIVQKIYGDEWKSRIKEYSQKYPDVPIIDPPEMVEKLRDRISMLDVVNQIDVSQEKETFGIPKQVVVYDQKGLSDDISDALNILSFPIIAKPLAASGTDASHKMELVFHCDGLLKLKPPIVLQEFVNHGGVIFKVYVAGDHVNCVKRKSLPDISEEKLKRCEGSVQFSLISNMSMKDHKAEEGKYYEKMHLEDAVMPPISFVTDIARGLRRAMGLNLFNFDVIRDAKVGNHYVVVDINYFPGYAKMPSYETVLTDFFCDIVRTDIYINLPPCDTQTHSLTHSEMQRPMKSDVEEGIDCSGAYLVWEDLTAVIRNDRSSRRLIDGLTGYALPGRITAIMGPSGSGKSTLLDSLAGRVSNNVVLKGSVLLNGRKQRLEYGVVAYVTQENTLLGTLTVRETIWYSAKLRLPSCRSKEEIRDVVEGTIIQMGLSDCADRKIGNWHLRGISGGEKKRVSIALEIVTSPKILFLDEPTTGLDSASAFFVMHTLRQMAQTGKTVVSSVHQPSGEVYSTFDDLCLLSSGEAVYFGEAKLATEFFAQVGFRCPRRRNPSDHFLRCINTDFDSVNESLKQSRRNVSEDSCATSDPLLNMETSIIKNMLIDRFQTSGYSETVRKQIAGISRFEGLSVVYGTGSEAGWWTQLNILIKRSSLNMSRDYGYYWLRIFVYIAVSLCVGTIFFSVGTTYNSILARAASGGFVTGFMTFMSIGGFPSFVEEMKVFQHERLNGYYGVGVYTISNFVSSSPFLLAITVSSGLITYFMVKLHPGISHLLYFLFNLHICMAIIESLMMIVTSMVPNFLMGMVTGAGVIGIMMMTAGFFRLLSDLPKPFWRYPVSYISYGSWALQGQYKNDFLGLEFDAEVKGKPKLTGDYIIKNIYGVSLNHSKWVDLGVLIVLLVSYRLIFFLVLKLQERTKPMMRGIHDRSLLGKTEKTAGSSPSADGTLERNEGDRSRWVMELNTTHH